MQIDDADAEIVDRIFPGEVDGKAGAISTQNMGVDHLKSLIELIGFILSFSEILIHDHASPQKAGVDNQPEKEAVGV